MSTLESVPVNSPDYWDARFDDGDWEKKGGRHQTFAFGQLVLSSCPAWLMGDIERNKLSICDWGCALGETTSLWAARFPGSAVTGVDISPKAVKRAREAYQNARFVAEDLGRTNDQYDVMFSSNTLEHFDDPNGMLDVLAAHARRHIVLLLPFEEYERFEEHRFTFEFSNLRESVGGRLVLAHCRVFDAESLAGTYWAGKQVLLIYVNAGALESGEISLSDGVLTPWCTVLPGASGNAVARIAAERLKAGDIDSRLRRSQEQATRRIGELQERQEVLGEELRNERAQVAERDRAIDEQNAKYAVEIAKRDEALRDQIRNHGVEIAKRDRALEQQGRDYEAEMAKRDRLLAEQQQSHQGELAKRDAALEEERDRAHQAELASRELALAEQRREHEARLVQLQEERDRAIQAALAERDRVVEAQDRAYHAQIVQWMENRDRDHRDAIALRDRRTEEDSRKLEKSVGDWQEERQRVFAAELALRDRAVEDLKAKLAETGQDRRRFKLITSPRRWAPKIKATTMRMLRRVYLGLPAPQSARVWLKRRFYGVLGRINPKSYWYRRYLDSKQFEPAARPSRPSRSATPPAPIPISPTQPFDVIVFPVIDWAFRVQRPQHLARQLAQRGQRVWYIGTTFMGEGTAMEPREVAPNVWTVNLPCPGQPPVIYNRQLDEGQLRAVVLALEEFRMRNGNAPAVCKVDHPFWGPVAMQLANRVVVYDCMDHHPGFSNTGDGVSSLENDLLGQADLVLASSQRLYDLISPRTRRCELLRNAGEYEHFATAPPTLAIEKKRPIIGYYGAIAEWFDMQLVASAAAAMPECDFVLVGSTFGADVTLLDGVDNVKLMGEVSYAELPGYLHAFDVCMIPFRKIDLTLCTNPVKIYEYLSAGKEVVAVRLPELEAIGPLIRLADSTGEFIEALRQALQPAPAEVVEQRRAFARENTWEQRGAALMRDWKTLVPKVSIVVLTCNHLEFTQACLFSLERFTGYPNYEIVVVDNASTDGTRDYLADFAKDRPHVRLVLSERNEGFAGGNNLGARAATGEYLVFLNNDTFVTHGWVDGLLRHLRRDAKIGMVGPVTNNIGNEARIDIAYADMDAMAAAAKRYTDAHHGERMPMRSLAFFCVMMPRKVWDEVGELDPGFEIGFFEDDDYAMRAGQKGYEMVCAEDVFVHHHLSASFSALPQARRDQLFEANRAHYESKWGPWTPHRYRSSSAAAAEE